MRKAKVHSKLHAMITRYFGPVIDELVLMFIFDQRAVAAGRIQTVAEIGQLGILIVPAVPLECRQTSGGGIARDVQPTQSQSFRRRNIRVWFDRMRIVFEPAEPEVGKQCGADRLVESRRQAMIVNDGAAAQSSLSTT